MRKLRNKNNIAKNVKNLNKRLFASAMFYTQLSTGSPIISLRDDSLTTTPLQSPIHFSEYFTSTYHTDVFRPLPTLLTSPEEMSLVMIAPTQVSGILSYFNLMKSLYPNHIYPGF